MPRNRFIIALAAILAPLAAAAAGAGKAAPVTDQICLDCHSDNTLTMEKSHRQVSLFADPAVIAKSAHAALKCIDCHDGFNPTAIPHKKTITPVDCASCHDDIGARHAFHRRLALNPIPAGADTACTDCHGTHAITASNSPDFPFVRAHQTEACGRCHKPAQEEFAASAHGKAFGAADAPSCLVCHEKAIVSPVRGRPDLSVKLAQAALCESCHVDKPSVASQALRGTHFVAAFDQSVHGAALHRGNAEAANCVDCHGAHEMNRAMAASARMGKLRAAETCAKCHAAVAAVYQGSVHAAALRRGSLDSPTCTDCHGEHDIRSHTDPTSPVYASNVARQVCATCHASVPLTKKYGLASNAFQTFSDSYHGLAEREGSLTVANCASCHTSHDIKSPLDPTSSVNKANLVKTCGQCHPGANTRFALGSVHVSLSAPDGKDEGAHILHLIASLYVILIVVVVGGMLLHNALDFLKKIRRKLAIQKGLIEEEHVAHRLYLRMTAHERMQHATLVLSFLVLVVTGFMLHYPDAWWVAGIRRASQRVFELRGLIHRIAGAVMLAAAAWHIAYLGFTKPGRGLFRDLLPRMRDLTDPFKVLKYNIGLAPDKPRFGRFSYIEKAEYWALVWGTILMGVTGAVLWFENFSIGHLTKLGFDISHTVHFYEAILATLAIIVWHFYFVIFNPDIYPMNLSWLTGRMSEREMLEEHPAELERLKAEEAKPKDPPEAKA
ncbi:MAG: cytochrome b/b6 domain-containing protein [Opitutaceae bacterium]|jgi:formate dehydrogenase gamma subunit